MAILFVTNGFVRDPDPGKLVRVEIQLIPQKYFSEDV